MNCKRILAPKLKTNSDSNNFNYPNLDSNRIQTPNLKIRFFFTFFFARIFDYIYKKEDKKILILDRVQKRKINSKK